MRSFQNFIVRLIPNHPPPLETRIWKLVVRALVKSVKICRFKTFWMSIFARGTLLLFRCLNIHVKTFVLLRYCARK